MFIPYWPEGVTRLLQIAIAAISLFLVANGHPKFPARANVGYALSKKGREYAMRAWKRASTALGLLVLTLDFFDPLIATFVLLMGVVLITIYSIMEAERGATMDEVTLEGGTVVRPMEAARYLFLFNVVVAIAPVVLLILAYPLLPNKVVVHFDVGWRPNGWMNKEGFVLTSAILMLSIGSLASWFSYLAWKKPEALMNDSSSLLLVGTLAEVFAAVVLIYLVFYNLSGHP